MIPSRRPGGSTRGPRFARTFTTSESTFQPTRVPGHPSRQQAPPPSVGGMTTVVQPDEPHYFGVRTDRQRALVTGNLCRCHDPASHNDAWSLQGPEYAASEMDNRGNMISWKELANRVLNFYGRPFVTRKEEYESYRYLLHRSDYHMRMQQYNALNRHVGEGYPVICTPYPTALQSHEGDGHARNEVTESGVRTMVNRPGHFSGPGPFGGSSGVPRFSRR